MVFHIHAEGNLIVLIFHLKVGEGRGEKREGKQEKRKQMKKREEKKFIKLILLFTSPDALGCRSEDSRYLPHNLET